MSIESPRHLQPSSSDISIDWQEPEIFKASYSDEGTYIGRHRVPSASETVIDPANATAADRLAALSAPDSTVQVIDPIKHIADDLFELHHPELKPDDAKRAEFVQNIAEQGDEFGHWVYFPWKRALVHYPDRQDLEDLQANRNLKLVERDDQKSLGKKKIVSFGLSVGHSILRLAAQSGIGTGQDGSLTFIDFDDLSVSNTNRLPSDMDEVGLPKVDIMARRLSERNPWSRLVRLPEGYTPNVDAVIDAEAPDIYVEEVDNSVAKAQIRALAKKNKKPLIMVTDMGDKSILYVERYDTDPDLMPFNKRLSKDMYDQLVAGTLPQDQMIKAMMSIAGLKHVLRTPKLIESFMAIGTELGGLPQLGTTVTAGAALGVTAMKHILLGHDLPTGTYIEFADKTLKMKRQTSIREHAKILWDLQKAIKNQKSNAKQ